MHNGGHQQKQDLDVDLMVSMCNIQQLNKIILNKYPKKKKHNNIQPG